MMRKIIILAMLLITLVPIASAQMSIWSMPQSVKHGWMIGQMLDTFQMHIYLQSNVSITVGVMTLQQYAILQYDVMSRQNIPYNTITFYNGTTIDFLFNESEGCDSYIYIIYRNDYSLGPFKINPDVTATYNPSRNKLTGICASTSD